MLGIITILTISWALLHWLENKNLHALGAFPITKRLKQFATGFLVAAILRIIFIYLETIHKSLDWQISSELNAALILNSTWWDIISVLTEELVFRGALLIILISKIGAKKSIIISATAFGIFHWFTSGVLGNPIPMLIIFVGSGLMGYAWALAFHKTNSIMLPFGLHLGWNLIQNTLFSKGPLGQVILQASQAAELSGIQSLISFLSSLIIPPIILILFVKHKVKTMHSPVDQVPFSGT